MCEGRLEMYCSLRLLWCMWTISYLSIPRYMILSEIHKIYFWYCACILVILTLILPVSNTKHACVDSCKCFNKHAINMWNCIYCLFIQPKVFVTRRGSEYFTKEYLIGIWLSYRQKKKNLDVNIHIQVIQTKFLRQNPFEFFNVKCRYFCILERFF